MADVGDGSGPVNIGQQNIVAAAADATMRFEISTRLPHGSVTPAVGVAATISVDLFTSANQTISAYAGETPLGNFYPYIQVIRR